MPKNNNRNKNRSGSINKIDLNELDSSCNQEFATILDVLGGAHVQCLLQLVKNDRKVNGTLCGNAKKYGVASTNKLVVVEPIDENSGNYIIRYICTDKEKKKLKREGRLKKNITITNDNNSNKDIVIGSKANKNNNNNKEEFDEKFIEEITKEGISLLDI